MRVQPYIFFNGKCEEALEFYKQALGAKVTGLMRFKDNPDPAMNPPNSEEKIMHAAVSIGETDLLVSDGECGGSPNIQGVSLVINVKSAVEAETCFRALSEGGQVRMPLGKTFFASSFGMLSDRFGVGWMVIAQ
jgi:PhnB protein